MSIGAFTLIRNESFWIAAHLLRILPFIDEAVLFDGNSTDGTIEIIEAIRDNTEYGHKIRLFKKKDPANLQDAYVGMFNECLHSLRTDLAWFAHPDMFVVDPARILAVKDSEAMALSTRIRSFAGEPGGQLYEIKGRTQNWKNIDRLRNPDLGAVYHGHYGVWNEGVYPTAIVGESRELHNDLSRYPYEVEDSGIEVFHYSDVRPYARRLDRMRKCLANQGQNVGLAESHPRVTLKDGQGFRFEPAEWPIELVEAREKYAHLEKTPAYV